MARDTLICLAFRKLPIWFKRKAPTMPFPMDGFLSPEHCEFPVRLRSVPAYKAWFDFGKELNRLGLAMLNGQNVPTEDNVRLTMAGLFVRAHKSMQAALILCEMGLVGDARAVLRTGVEGAIALNALANEPKFLDQLIEANHFNRRKFARIVLDNPEYRSSYTADQIAEMERVVREVDEMESNARDTAQPPEKNLKGRRVSDINWAEAARKPCPDLYNLHYRLLSSDGTHTTIDSIGRSFEYEPGTGKILCVKVGPDISSLVETLKAACLMFLWAAIPFERAYNQPAAQVRLEEMMKRFTQLPQDEPNASIAPIF